MSKLIAGDYGHWLTTAGKRTPPIPGYKSPITGKNFMHEWEFNSGVGKYLKPELLRCGFRYIEVSSPYADTPLGTRAANARRAGADFFLSIHANANDGDFDGNGIDGKDPRGVETLAIMSGETLRMAKIIQRHLVAASGLRDRGVKDGEWLGVISGTRSYMPGALVECGFMDNIVEARKLTDESYRKAIAVGLAKAMCEIFGMKYVPEAPKTLLDEDDAEEVIEYISASWMAVRDESQRKYYHWLANELRYASGILKPVKPLAKDVADTIIASWLKKEWAKANEAGDKAGKEKAARLADALRVASGQPKQNG